MLKKSLTRFAPPSNSVGTQLASLFISTILAIDVHFIIIFYYNEYAISVDSVAYSFGEKAGLIHFKVRGDLQYAWTRSVSIAFGLTTRQSSAVIIRLQSVRSTKYMQISLVSTFMVRFPDSLFSLTKKRWGVGSNLR